MEAAIIRGCKPLIATAPLPILQEHYAALMPSNQGAAVDWPYILQKLYIHACLKGRRDVATWLASLFDALDPISRIAYRHTLAYGRALLQRVKARE
jgi:hypothetical protein